MAKQRISANQVSVGTAGSGSVLSSNGTVAYWSNTLTITANALVLSAGSNTAAPLKFTSGNTLYIANAGVIEYTGTAFYATPVGQQRGVVPGEQFYMLGNTLAAANTVAATTLGLFANVGVTLSSNTVYRFEGQFAMTRTSGTTSHTIATTFGGTANNYNILYTVVQGDATGSIGTLPTGNRIMQSNTVANTVVTSGFTAASQIMYLGYFGTITINNGGTLIPQFALSAAPGGNYNILAGSYFKIYPISTGSANISIGTWA